MHKDNTWVDEQVIRNYLLVDRCLLNQVFQSVATKYCEIRFTQSYCFRNGICPTHPAHVDWDWKVMEASNIRFKMDIGRIICSKGNNQTRIMISSNQSQSWAEWSLVKTVFHSVSLNHHALRCSAHKSKPMNFADWSDICRLPDPSSSMRMLHNKVKWLQYHLWNRNSNSSTNHGQTQFRNLPM